MSGISPNKRNTDPGGNDSAAPRSFGAASTSQFLHILSGRKPFPMAFGDHFDDAVDQLMMAV